MNTSIKKKKFVKTRCPNFTLKKIPGDLCNHGSQALLSMECQKNLPKVRKRNHGVILENQAVFTFFSCLILNSKIACAQQNEVLPSSGCAKLLVTRPTASSHEERLSGVLEWESPHKTIYPSPVWWPLLSRQGEHSNLT